MDPADGHDVHTDATASGASPFATLEAVVPHAPVPELVPRTLAGRLRRQDRGGHAAGWTPDLAAGGWGGETVEVWRRFRATYEHTWTLGPVWQQQVLAEVATPVAELAGFVDAADGRAGTELAGDIPSTYAAELDRFRERLQALTETPELAAVALQAGYLRWPVGAAGAGRQPLNAAGTVSLAHSSDGCGQLSADGLMLAGWTLTGDGLWLRTPVSGTDVPEGVWSSEPTVAALLRISRGQTAVDVVPATAREAVGPYLSSVAAACQLASRLHRPVLLVTTELAVGLAHTGTGTPVNASGPIGMSAAGDRPPTLGDR